MTRWLVLAAIALAGCDAPQVSRADGYAFERAEFVRDDVVVRVATYWWAVRMDDWSDYGGD